MSIEYKLSHTAAEIDEKLSKVDSLVASVNGIVPDENGNVAIAVSGGNVENGEDGFSPIATVEQTETGAVITITDKDGTTTATITNGKDGADGQPGTDGYTLVRGVDYWTSTDKQEIKKELVSEIITNESGESESLVMSQKAVTELVSEALGTGGSASYETVDSVEDMIDTSKSYVLSSTGTIWVYREFTTKKEPENKFVPATAEINSRYGTSSISEATGYFVSDYIKVDKFAEVDPYIMRLFKSSGVGFNNLDGNARIHYFNSSKTLLGNKYLRKTAAATSMTRAYVDENGNDYYHIDECQAVNGGGVTEVQEIPEFDHSEVAYIRVTLPIYPDGSMAITIADIENVIITFDADAGTVTEQKWYDTEMNPSASGGTGNYVTLLTKIDKNASDISVVEDRLSALESGSDTVAVPAFWKTAVDSVIAKIKTLQVGRNCVTFPFFSDNHQRNGYSGILIRKVMDECHIPYCFYGGDSIDSGYIASEAVMVEQDKKFDTMMSVVPNGRFCRAVGNHDGYWAVSANEKHYYTREQIYELFLREESIAQNKYFGGDGTYYYVDELASKVRFIVLNTNGGSVDDTQLAWFRDIALKVDEDWAVVVISHQPISNHYHANISNAAAVRAIVTENDVEIIGWFSGHIHRDRIYTGVAVNTTDDSQGVDMGFKQVTITSDHTGIAYDDATKHTVANDALSHAIDFVTINRDTKTVSLTRLGIGNNRVYSYNNAVLYSVTNSLTNVTTNNATSSVEEGSGYSATLTASSGYELDMVTVIMGGTNITATAYSNGKITIAEVIGDIVITATAEKAADPTVPITWKNGYTCTHAVGSVCTETESANYAISENIPVTEGETYVLSRSDGNVLTTGSKFNLVELNANNVVVASIELKYDGLGGNTTYTYKPSSGVTQMKFRGYSTAYEEYQKFVLTKQ